jgi:hypothetical protein
MELVVIVAPATLWTLSNICAADQYSRLRRRLEVRRVELGCTAQGRKQRDSRTAGQDFRSQR